MFWQEKEAGGKRYTQVTNDYSHEREFLEIGELFDADRVPLMRNSRKVHLINKMCTYFTFDAESLLQEWEGYVQALRDSYGPEWTPSDWWGVVGGHWALAIQWVLSIQVTSVPCERAFSVLRAHINHQQFNILEDAVRVGLIISSHWSFMKRRRELINEKVKKAKLREELPNPRRSTRIRENIT